MIHQDRNISVADSEEDRERFGHQQGSYRCLGKYRANATTLNFTFAASGEAATIARTDWQIDRRRDGSVSGAAIVTLWKPVESCQPLRDPRSCEPPEGPFDFTFTGAPIVPPED